ncbi:hypothetical protein ACFLV8_01525 [Chloroflexota bacterium]
MEPTVLHIIGTNFRPEKEEEINIWYTTHHTPLILKGPATRFERCQRIGDDETYPKYLAIYEFESEKVLNDYLRSPLANEVQKDAQSWRERGDITDAWSVSYKLTAARGDTDRSLAFRFIATNLPHGANEDEFNEWYNNDHIPTVMGRNPLLIRFERYQRIGDEGICPKYLAFHRYANEMAIQERVNDFTSKIADAGGRKIVYPDGVWWEPSWRVAYKLITRWRKDDWICA